MLDRAFDTFKKTTDRPTLIIVDSHIGYGAPNKQDTHAAHGEPLGEEEIRLDQAVLRLAGGREVPRARRRARALRGRASARAGRSCAASGWRCSRRYKAEYPDGSRRARPHAAPAAARGLGQGPARRSRPTPRAWPAATPRPRCSTRSRTNVPWLIGGSADLAPSTKTRLTFEGAGDFEAGRYGGRNFHFGIREHAMGAVLNGLSLSKVRPYGSGFLIFSDYGRAADPPGRDHGDPGHLRLHARLDRRGRGRADAPAGRAAAVAARDPGPDHDPARRRQRGGRGLARDPAVPPRAGRR